MRRILIAILIAICLWPQAGCRWAGLRDPVPVSLAASRRLSSEGNELLERKQPEKAEAKLAEAVRTCPTDCDARRYYAETLWLRNARPEAAAQLEEACRLSPESDVRVRLAEMYVEMGRLDEAERNIDHVISQNLKLASAWRVHGRVLRCRGDQLVATGDRERAQSTYFQALADLHRAAGCDQADHQVIGETAAVYRSLGQPQRALETMQGLLETYSPGEEPQAVLYWTGLDYMALDRFDDAAASFNTALSRDRPTPELLYHLGVAQYRGGRSQDAIVVLRQALALDPRHAPSQQLLDEIQVAQHGAAVLRR
jgi:tetratricopeptide (TPR) repeat protein